MHNSPGSPLRLALCLQRWTEHGPGSLALPPLVRPLLCLGRRPLMSGPSWEGESGAFSVLGTPCKEPNRGSPPPRFSPENFQPIGKDVGERFQADPPTVDLGQLELTPPSQCPPRGCLVPPWSTASASLKTFSFSYQPFTVANSTHLLPTG